MPTTNKNYTDEVLDSTISEHQGNLMLPGVLATEFVAKPLESDIIFGVHNREQNSHEGNMIYRECIDAVVCQFDGEPFSKDRKRKATKASREALRGRRFLSHCDNRQAWKAVANENEILRKLGYAVRDAERKLGRKKVIVQTQTHPTSKFTKRTMKQKNGQHMELGKRLQQKLQLQKQQMIQSLQLQEFHLTQPTRQQEAFFASLNQSSHDQNQENHTQRPTVTVAALLNQLSHLEMQDGQWNYFPIPLPPEELVREVDTRWELKLTPLPPRSGPPITLALQRAIDECRILALQHQLS